MGVIFGVAKISIIFLGCLKFLIFLGVNDRCWARAYVCRNNEAIAHRSQRKVKKEALRFYIRRIYIF